MTAADMLRYARRRRGWSQRALAEASGVAQPAIARIESGRVVPRIDTLNGLLAICGYLLEPSPRLGVGVDRTGIRERLALTATERLDLTVAAARNLARLRGES
ncbi:MAG: helix-turn-helix domain-containing protein [Actinobacteria bacterium]|nr:helix-turn-helix domain-containing protein [Actinomycetota bacterium]